MKVKSQDSSEVSEINGGRVKVEERGEGTFLIEGFENSKSSSVNLILASYIITEKLAGKDINCR